MSRQFSSFKTMLSRTLSALSPKLRPVSFNSTATKTYSTLFRLPTITFEQTYLSIFGLSENDFPERLNVADKSAELRQNSTDMLKEKKVQDSFMNYPALVTRSLNIVTDMLRLTGVRFTPVSIDKSLDELPKNTSSGFPDYVTPKGDILFRVRDLAVYCLATGDDTWANYITSMAWRTQVRPKGLKFRIIWVVPYLIQAFEMMFCLPFFEHFRNIRDTAYCFGNVFTDLKPRIQACRSFKQIVSIDFTSFDATVSPELLVLFFKWLKSHIDIKNKRFNDIFESIVIFGVNALVCANDNNVPSIFRKNGSVISGSVFTNFADTFINLFSVTFVLLKMDIDPTKCKFNALGDDNLICLPVEIDLNLFSDLLFRHFGLVVEPGKCDVYGPDFDTVEFLGGKLNENGRYIDVKLAKQQLCLTTSFISEELMSTEERLFSKLASISFKFSDGHIFFDSVYPELSERLGLSTVPDRYSEIFFSAAGPYDINVKRSTAEFKYEGWMMQ